MSLRALGLPLLLLALVAAGCSDGGGRGAGAGAAPHAAADAGAFPVTIEHARGSTTIDSEPERIVTVGLRDQESLLALGVKAVGAMDWFQQDTFAKWPWERWGGEEPEIVSSGGFDVNFEQVAALRPDLILGVYQELDRSNYRKLSKIAPTIAHSPDHKPYTIPWREETRTIAAAVGRTAEGERLIDEVEERFAKVREEHPELQGKEAIIADPGTGKIFAFTSKDQRGQFLKEMGLESSTRIDKISKDGFGAELSNEQLRLLDVDHLFFLIDRRNGAKAFDNPLVRRLDVYRRGKVVELPYYDPPQYGAAVAFSTVLSIPYAIDGTLKQIEKARAGSPRSRTG